MSSQETLSVTKSITVVPGMVAATSVLEADYPEWSAGATYAKNDRAIIGAAHKVYESRADANTGNNPASSALWVEVGWTNRYRMFDLSVSTKTLLANGDYYELTLGKAVTTLALLNIAGLTSVRVRMTDPTFGLVFDETFSLLALPSRSSMWEWFFGERKRKKQLVVEGLPSYPFATIRIDFGASTTATVGAMVLGVRRSVGIGVHQGLTLGNQSFSRKSLDEWGEAFLLKLKTSRRVSFDVLLDNARLDWTYDLLDSLDATPCLWRITGRYESLLLFGFYKDFQITIPYANNSDASIEIENFT